MLSSMADDMVLLLSTSKGAGPELPPRCTCQISKAIKNINYAINDVFILITCVKMTIN